MFKKRLFSGEPPVYRFPAAAKSAAGIGVLSNSMVTPDAPCVFFCVFASVHPFYGQWLLRHCLVCVMVARAGASHEAPVSIEAGYANPVRATTSEIGVSGGGVNRYSMESATMAATLISARMQFTFLFAAVRRADTAARRLLARDYVLSFAGRLPLCEVAA